MIEQREKFPDYDARIAVIIAEAIRMDIIPHKYLLDAETLAQVILFKSSNICTFSKLTLLKPKN